MVCAAALIFCVLFYLLFILFIILFLIFIVYSFLLLFFTQFYLTPIPCYSSQPSDRRTFTQILRTVSPSESFKSDTSETGGR